MKAAGKPRQGPIFNKRQVFRAQYRKRIPEGQKQDIIINYTNDLHEALLAKNGPTFWKCWLSKFETRPGCTEVDGFVDPDMIANNFAEYFSGIYAPNNDQRAAALYNEYVVRRKNYFGYPFPSDSIFDTEIVSKVMLDLKCG